MTMTNKVPVRTPERERVYDVIDGERDYQIENDPAGDKEMTPGETLMMIEENLRFAKEQWSNQPEGRINTINHLRKLAGITVRALESFGPIPREYHVPASANITGTLQGRDKNDRL